MKISTISCPKGLSPTYPIAVRSTISRAQDHNAESTIFHINSVSVPDVAVRCTQEFFTRFNGSNVQDVFTKVKRVLESRLGSQIEASAPISSRYGIFFIVAGGDPHREIVYTPIGDADLIVIATRRRAVLGRLFPRNGSEWVSRGARWCVLSWCVLSTCPPQMRYRKSEKNFVPC